MTTGRSTRCCCWTTCSASWDPRRQEFVLNHIQGGQVFITCCEEERLAALRDGKVFRVRNGEIQEEG